MTFSTFSSKSKPTKIIIPFSVHFILNLCAFFLFILNFIR